MSLGLPGLPEGRTANVRRGHCGRSALVATAEALTRTAGTSHHGGHPHAAKSPAGATSARALGRSCRAEGNDDPAANSGVHYSRSTADREINQRTGSPCEAAAPDLTPSGPLPPGSHPFGPGRWLPPCTSDLLAGPERIRDRSDHPRENCPQLVRGVVTKILPFTDGIHNYLIQPSYNFRASAPPPRPQPRGGFPSIPHVRPRPCRGRTGQSLYLPWIRRRRVMSSGMAVEADGASPL